MVESFCQQCGNPIAKEHANTTNKKYCCKNCARIAANAQKVKIRAAQKRKEASVAKGPGLDFCMQEADRLGISYGQYMARRDLL